MQNKDITTESKQLTEQIMYSVIPLLLPFLVRTSNTDQYLDNNDAMYDMIFNALPFYLSYDIKEAITIASMILQIVFIIIYFILILQMFQLVAEGKDNFNKKIVVALILSFLVNSFYFLSFTILYTAVLKLQVLQKNYVKDKIKPDMNNDLIDNFESTINKRYKILKITSVIWFILVGLFKFFFSTGFYPISIVALILYILFLLIVAKMQRDKKALTIIPTSFAMCFIYLATGNTLFTFLTLYISLKTTKEIYVIQTNELVDEKAYLSDDKETLDIISDNEVNGFTKAEETSDNDKVTLDILSNNEVNNFTKDEPTPDIISDNDFTNDEETVIKETEPTNKEVDSKYNNLSEEELEKLEDRLELENVSMDDLEMPKFD